MHEGAFFHYYRVELRGATGGERCLPSSPVIREASLRGLLEFPADKPAHSHEREQPQGPRTQRGSEREERVGTGTDRVTGAVHSVGGTGGIGRDELVRHV